MPTDCDIFRAITSTWCLNVRCLSKIIPKNLILLVSSIVADPILILVKCNSVLYVKIIYFVLSALIQIRFYVSQLLTLLCWWLRVNVSSIAFSSANEVDRVLSSANSINFNKDDEFGRSFINIRNNPIEIWSSVSSGLLQDSYERMIVTLVDQEWITRTHKWCPMILIVKQYQNCDFPPEKVLQCLPLSTNVLPYAINNLLLPQLFDRHEWINSGQFRFLI